jgi:hypothetical protein
MPWGSGELSPGVKATMHAFYTQVRMRPNPTTHAFDTPVRGCGCASVRVCVSEWVCECLCVLCLCVLCLCV